MKKILFISLVVFSALWPLACANRPFSTPVRPVLPTATPTQVVTHLICTITPTVAVTLAAESEPATLTGANDSFGTAEPLGTLTSLDLYLNGNLAGTSTSEDNDYYSFTAGVNGTWTLYLDCFIAPPTPLIYVYDSTKTNPVGTYAITPSGNPMASFAVTGAPAVYYLRVSGYGGQNYTAKILHP